MMKNKITAIVEKINSSGDIKISDWRLDTVQIARQERYYISSDLDQARAVDEILRHLTVYVDGEAPERSRGEAKITISPSHSDGEIEALIRRAAFAASKSRNPWFALPGPSSAKVKLPPSSFEELDEAERIEQARTALYSPNPSAVSEPALGKTENSPLCKINALELFISEEQKTLQNSQGLDVSWKTWNGYSEFVVDAKSGEGNLAGKDLEVGTPILPTVELFDSIAFSEPDQNRLSAATSKRLAQVADRFGARPMPQLKDVSVILTGKEAEEIFSWFFNNSTTQAIFTKASAFALGMNVQSGAETDKETDPAQPIADPFDMWAEPLLPGLVSSSPFDPEGFPLERVLLIEGGVLKTLIGPLRYADWLGVARRGSYPLFSVSPGKMSVAKMRKEPYLEPAMFSDFRLDGVTGDFGAEVRLAYYFDGKKRIPVTGGSISGSLSALRSSMVRSEECALGSVSYGPTAVMLRGASVTSAGNQA